MNLIESLEWRYATKKFDASKKVSQADIDMIEKATLLAASSYGLQPYKVLKIEDPVIRKALQPVSWNQTQIVDASHLYVFCNFLDFTDEKIDGYIQLKSDIQNIPVEALEGYGTFMKQKIGEKSNEEITNWTAKQAYIAMTNMLTACAIQKIDACPMEGFDADAYDKILGLKSKGLEAAVVVAVGYHADEDQTFGATKVRKSYSELFITI